MFSVFELFQLLLRGCLFIAGIVQRFVFTDTRCIPKAKDPVLSYSINEITSKIRKRELKCEDVVRKYVQRVKNVNPGINAVAQDRFEEAVREARELDARVESGEVNDLPLLGVPFTVKQIIGVKDMSSRHGSLHVPEDSVFCCDSEVVRRLKAAGAIPMLISITPEISCGYETYNLYDGYTRNPWKFSLTCGGSSGGEAALLACNASVFGLGTDLAGSIRLPTHFCGVCGHKPTPGLVPKDEVYPIFRDVPLLAKYNVVGPMAKSIPDLKQVFQILTDNAPELELERPVERSRVKVLYAKQLESRVVMADVDRDMQDRIEKVVLELAGEHEVKPFDTKKFYFLPEVVSCKLVPMTKYPYLLQSKPNYLSRDPVPRERRSPPLWKEALKSLFWMSSFSFQLIFFECARRWKGTLFGDHKKWWKVADEMETQMHDLLGSDTVLVLPTFPTSAVPHASMFFRPVDAIYMHIANAFGLPSTQVPIGLNSKGLPIGLQVIGGPKMDRLTLAVAQEIEAFVRNGKVAQ